MNWINFHEQQPESDEMHYECNEYYLIWTENFGASFAMFINNEWWSTYESKVSANVTHWCKITKPD